jgi:hypothetical protein
MSNDDDVLASGIRLDNANLGERNPGTQHDKQSEYAKRKRSSVQPQEIVAANSHQQSP